MNGLTVAQAKAIHDAYRYRRQEYHFSEDSEMSMLVVLLNAGAPYTPVRCVGGEWSGVKGDLPRQAGLPHCPNGHVLTEGPGVVLGFVPEDGAS